MSPELLEHARGAVRILTLNRPAKRNALTPAMVDGLRRGIAAVAADPEVRVVLITGTPPAFCAGMDLHVALAAGEDSSPGERLARELDLLLREIEVCPLPVIAAVNGAAVAGGAALMSACDIAVAAESATIGYPGIRRGLVAALVMPPLVRCVGYRRAAHLLMTGELVTAADALAMGLVSECVADERCLPRALELAERLANYPAGALAETKRLLARIASGAAGRVPEMHADTPAPFQVMHDAASSISGSPGQAHPSE